MFEDNTFENVKIIDFSLATKLKSLDKPKKKRIGNVSNKYLK